MLALRADFHGQNFLIFACELRRIRRFKALSKLLLNSKLTAYQLMWTENAFSKKRFQIKLINLKWKWPLDREEFN